MTPRLVLALVRRGGISLLAAVALGWWVYHLDNVTRSERAASEQGFREERAAERKDFTDTLRRIADACLSRRAAPAAAVVP